MAAKWGLIAEYWDCPRSRLAYFREDQELKRNMKTRKGVKLLLIAVAAITVLTALALSAEGFFSRRAYLEPWSRDYYRKYDDPRTQLIAHGILAANGHNLQNWRFVYSKSDPLSFDMYVETARLAPEVDPYHTQVIISQGTLFEYLAIAGQQLGYTPSANLFPDGEIPRNATHENLMQKRVAAVKLIRDTPRSSSLYDQMFRPDTSRLAYLKAAIPAVTIDRLNALNDFIGLKMAYVAPGSALYAKVQRYVIDSARIESEVPEVMAESQKLFRKNEKEKNQHRYGFSLEGSSMSEPQKTLLQTLLTLFPAMNSTEAAAKNFLAQTALAATENAGFMTIVAEQNTRKAQFNAGRLYSRIQLSAHTEGYALQPLSQAIQEYEQMRTIYRDAHADLVRPGETVLMLFRIGRPVGQTSLSMRKDVTEFITD